MQNINAFKFIFLRRLFEKKSMILPSVFTEVTGSLKFSEDDQSYVIAFLLNGNETTIQEPKHNYSFYKRGDQASSVGASQEDFSKNKSSADLLVDKIASGYFYNNPQKKDINSISLMLEKYILPATLFIMLFAFANYLSNLSIVLAVLLFVIWLQDNWLKKITFIIPILLVAISFFINKTFALHFSFLYFVLSFINPIKKYRLIKMSAGLLACLFIVISSSMLTYVDFMQPSYIIGTVLTSIAIFLRLLFGNLDRELKIYTLWSIPLLTTLTQFNSILLLVIIWLAIEWKISSRKNYIRDLR